VFNCRAKSDSLTIVVESRTGAPFRTWWWASKPENESQHFIGKMRLGCASPRKAPHFVTQFLNGRLRQPFPSLRYKLQRLYHHALAAACNQFLPPRKKADPYAARSGQTKSAGWNLTLVYRSSTIHVGA
jgi:hypothetical protein